MKNIKNIILSLIIICISIMIGIDKVDAEYYDGSIGGSSQASYISAGWDSTAVGVKIRVYDSNMSPISNAYGVVVNKRGITADYYTKVDKDKFSQTGSSQSTYMGSKPSRWFVNDNLGTTYSEGSTVIDLHAKLVGKAVNGKYPYTVLKSLLETIGVNELSNGQYIVVEPLLHIQDKKYEAMEETVCCTNVCYLDPESYEPPECHARPQCFSKSNLSVKPTKPSQIITYYKNCNYCHKYNGKNYCPGDTYTGTQPAGKTIDVEHGYVITYGKKYFLTPYEFKKISTTSYPTYHFGCASTNQSLDSCYGLTLPRIGKSLGTKETLKVGSTTYISGRTNWPDVSWGNSSTYLSCIKDSTGGCAIGWFRYDDIFDLGTKVIVSKIDAATKKGVAGAVLGLYEGTTKKYECTSGSDGKCTFNNVEVGKYKLKEITPPPNYVKSTEEKDVKVKTGDTVVQNITFENTKKPDPWVKKVDQDGKPLQGAIFSLYQNDVKKYTCTSAANGICKFSNVDYGNYKIKEDSAPASYIKSSDEPTVTIIAASGLLYTFTNIRKLDLEIKKTDDEGNLLAGAVFYLYKDTARTTYHCTSAANGICKFSGIPADGTVYTIKETQAPDGYSKSNGTCTYTASVGSTVSCPIFVNQPSCQTLFDRANSDGTVTMPERIKIYKSLKSSGDDFRALLNLANTTAEKACRAYTVPNNDTSACFSGGNGIGNIFEETNISNYNDVVSFNSNGTTVYGYCLTTAKFLPRIPSSGSTDAGRMLVSTKNAVTQSVLRTQCYLYKEDTDGKVTTYTGSTYYPLDYSKYIKNVKVTGDHKYLRKTLSKTINSAYNYKDGALYCTSIRGYYYFPHVYISNISGEPASSTCTNCTYLGRGLLSPLDEGTTGFKFSYDFMDKTYTGTCQYTTTTRIIDPPGELNLEFRIIDTHNPFPGKTGTNTRKIGSNWDKMVSISSTQKISLIDSEIKNAANSYGVVPSTKELRGPKYVITLLPNDISKIRKYNETHKYSNYNFDCSSGACINNFLKNLKNGKVGSKTISSKLILNNTVTSGWKKENGFWYYLNSSGNKITGFKVINGFTYYFNSDGIMQTGWQEINDKTYYFNSYGVMQREFKKIMGDWYYFESDGAMLTDTQTLNGKSYHFYSNGVMARGWYYYNFWRYYNMTSDKGVLRTGWSTLNEQKYYFDSSADGKMSSGSKTINDKKYYFNPGGEMLKGWQAYNSKWHYFDSNGVMATGTKTIDGVTYKFNTNGECTSNNC